MLSGAVLYTVKPLFIVFVWGLKKKQWIWENNRCGSHSWNRICLGIIEIERWIWENELSRNDRGFTVSLFEFGFCESECRGPLTWHGQFFFGSGCRGSPYIFIRGTTVILHTWESSSCLYWHPGNVTMSSTRFFLLANLIFDFGKCKLWIYLDMTHVWVRSRGEPELCIIQLLVGLPSAIHIHVSSFCILC
jgi:hypothetical protein